MKTKTFLFASFVALSTVIAACSSNSKSDSSSATAEPVRVETPSIEAGTYTIDPVHSAVEFKIRHLGISWVSGQFGTFEGSFTVPGGNIANLNASASIETATIDTDNEKRDGHLKSADFFDAGNYPTISFESTSVSAVNGNSLKLAGNLTIRGVSKPVVLDVEYGGSAKDPWGNNRAAFLASGTINRKDFGLTWNQTLETGGLLVGEGVKIILDVQGILKKEKNS